MLPIELRDIIYTYLSDWKTIEMILNDKTEESQCIIEKIWEISNVNYAIIKTNLYKLINLHNFNNKAYLYFHELSNVSKHLNNIYLNCNEIDFNLKDLKLLDKFISLDELSSNYFDINIKQSTISIYSRVEIHIIIYLINKYKIRSLSIEFWNGYHEYHDSELYYIIINTEINCLIPILLHNDFIYLHKLPQITSLNFLFVEIHNDFPLLENIIRIYIPMLHDFEQYLAYFPNLKEIIVKHDEIINNNIKINISLPKKFKNKYSFIYR